MSENYEKKSYSSVQKIAQAEVLQIDSAPPITPNEISSNAFPDHVLMELSKGVDENEVEIKPDGLIYLPEIKYRRILNSAFGAGGWVMIPRGAPAIRGTILYREYAMYCFGKFVSQAVGEQQIHSSMTEGTAVESSKSNSLIRCCKDLGIASELWDPNFIEGWKSKYALQVWCKNEKSGESKLLWRRKDRSAIAYPWKEQTPISTQKSKQTFSQPKIESYQSQQTPQQPAYQAKKQYQQPQQQHHQQHQQHHQKPSNERQKNRVYEEPQVEQPLEEDNVMLDEVDDVVPELENSFDPSEIVPPELKRFSGKSWEDVFASAEGQQYLNWALKHPKLGTSPKEKVKEALDWYSSQYPDQSE